MRSFSKVNSLQTFLQPVFTVGKEKLFTCCLLKATLYFLSVYTKEHNADMVFFNLFTLSSDTLSLLAVAYGGADTKSRVMCSSSHVAQFFSFFPLLINPLCRLQPMMAGWPAYMGIGEYVLLIYSFSTRPKNPSSPGRPKRARRCNVFDLWTLTLYQTLKLQSAGGPSQVIVNMWETHHRPRTMNPTGITTRSMVGFGKETCVLLKLAPTPRPHTTSTTKPQFCQIEPSLFLLENSTGAG